MYRRNGGLTIVLIDKEVSLPFLLLQQCVGNSLVMVGVGREGWSGLRGGVENDTSWLVKRTYIFMMSKLPFYFNKKKYF